jgi:FkbM family methyltransferase
VHLAARSETRTRAVLTDAHLRTLHELIPYAQLNTGFHPQYIEFVRALRERAHPRGTQDIRMVSVRPGLSFNVDVGDRYGCDIYFGYIQERFELEVFAACIHPGDVVADVGANFGLYAAFAAERVGATGQVLAFEPESHAFSLLEQNAALLGKASQVRCLPICVGAADGETLFHVAEESAFSGMSATDRAAIKTVVTVPLRTLDSLLPELGVHSLGAMKIDVEGHEADVLNGSANSVARSPDPLIMFEVSAKNLSDTAADDLVSVLEGLYAQSYQAWVPDTQAGGLRLLPHPADVRTVFSSNVFLVKRGTAREQLLREAATEVSRAPQALAPSDGLVANPRDSSTTYVFSADIVAAALRERDGQNAKLHERLNWLERDSQARLSTVRELEATIEQMRETQSDLFARLAATEEDSTTRLTAMRRFESEVLALRGAIADPGTADLSDLRAQLAQRDEALARLSSEVAERESRIAILERTWWWQLKQKLAGARRSLTRSADATRDTSSRNGG